MPGDRPNPTLLYRIIHIDNVEHVLVNGICVKNHANADPDYINIGDTGLIANRNEYNVGIIPPGGQLGEYVPFYFGPLSPMLLKIRDGHGGVTKRSQKDIVYIVCSLDAIVASCPNWCFTDGHAKNAITDFYNHVNDLDQVDWNMVGQQYWRDTEEDYDRMRRKQAEFLVRHHVPVNCILGIGTYDSSVQATVESIVNRLGLNIQVRVKRNFYY